MVTVDITIYIVVFVQMEEETEVKHFPLRVVITLLISLLESLRRQ